MLNFDEIINANSALISKKKSGVSGSDSALKVRFSVYVTLLKMGFFFEKDVVNNRLLENIPLSYYPCEKDLVHSFTVSNQTLSNIVKKHINEIKIELSSADEKSLLDLSKILPVTAEQANDFLIEKNVLSSENKISVSAIIYLLSLATKNDFKKEIIFTSPTESGTKHKRNTRESVTAILPESFCSKTFKSLCARTLRSNLTLAGVLGFSKLNKIIELELSLLIHSNDAKKIGILSTTTRNIFKKEVASGVTCFDVYLNFFTSFFDAKSGAEFFNDDLFFSDFSESDFLKKLSAYAYYKGGIFSGSIVEFCYRCLAFKSSNRKVSKTTSKRNCIDKIRYIDFLNEISLDDISEGTVINVMLRGNMFESIKSVMKDNKEFFEIKLNSSHEQFEWHTFFVSYLLDYVGEKSIDPYISQTDNAHKFLSFIAASEEEKMISSLTGNGCEYFSFNKEGKYYLSDDNIEYANNHSGKHEQPTYQNIQSSITQLIMDKQDYLTKLDANFDLYEKAFKSSWPNNKELLANFSKQEFIDDRNQWLLSSHPKKSESLVLIDIGLCKEQLSWLNKRLLFLQQTKGSDDPVLHNMLDRISRWEERLSANENSLLLLKNSEVQLKLQEFEKLIVEQELLARETVILPLSNRHMLVINNLLRDSNPLSKDELINKIKDYVKELSNLSSPLNSSQRVTIYALMSKHPFSVR